MGDTDCHYFVRLAHICHLKQSRIRVTAVNLSIMFLNLLILILIGLFQPFLGLSCSLRPVALADLVLVATLLLSLLLPPQLPVQLPVASVHLFMNLGILLGVLVHLKTAEQGEEKDERAHEDSWSKNGDQVLSSFLTLVSAFSFGPPAPASQRSPSMLASTSEGAWFAKAAQVWVAPHTVSISLAGFAKLSSSDIKHPHDEQQEEDVDRHGSDLLLLRRYGEIVRIPDGTAV